MKKYLAVDKKGSFYLFSDMPERVRDNQWFGDCIQCLAFVGNDGKQVFDEGLPDKYKTLTWEDEPVEVKCIADNKIIE